jgi:hypothetical protein
MNRVSESVVFITLEKGYTNTSSCLHLTSTQSIPHQQTTRTAFGDDGFQDMRMSYLCPDTSSVALIIRICGYLSLKSFGRSSNGWVIDTGNEAGEVKDMSTNKAN